ncbi:MULTISPECIES: hypothetical protein [Haloferax]|uniref:DUF7344 domain-containing protein n=1 Tax=Haloferax marinum TaxID=2666143 RepID=A0A6A8G8K0_9EURY|nr:MULTISPECIES: hypothetical protein [Haloferax]KAB1198130.1 hypothetical protein Hfx1150_11605 [Haloferax sp. CBA1150]MRW97207.1 hypothetical protein [Haloferax marinum]
MNIFEILLKKLGKLDKNLPVCNPATVSEYYDVLANNRRRQVAIFLAETNQDEVDVERIAEYLNTDGVDRHSARISLIQRHLPRLDSAGVVHYRRSEQTVEPLDGLSELCAAHDAFSRELN